MRRRGRRGGIAEKDPSGGGSGGAVTQPPGLCAGLYIGTCSGSRVRQAAPSKEGQDHDTGGLRPSGGPDNLLEALKGTSIEEEHCTIMSAVIQKVQLAKSGLTEACSNLLTGFEVRS